MSRSAANSINSTGADWAAACRELLACGADATALAIESRQASTVASGRYIDPATAETETYRVFIKGATGFVSMISVRSDAEQRATEFCGRKGKEIESLTETTAEPVVRGAASCMHWPHHWQNVAYPAATKGNQ